MEPEVPTSGPSYQIPLSPSVAEARKARRRIALAILIVIIVLIAAAVASYYVVPSVKDRVNQAIAARHVPADLRGATFVGYVGTKSIYYQAGSFGFTAVDTPTTVAGPMQSPSGALSAYADSMANGVHRTAVLGAGAVDPSVWFVNVQPQGGAPSIVANGFAPAFLDESHLAYFSPSGIVVRDLTASTSLLLFPYASGTPISQVQYSPDHAHVMWTNASTSETVVASISPTAYAPIHAFVRLESPILADTGLYELHWSGAGTELIRHSFDGSSSVTVLTIPESLSVRSLFQ